MSFNQRCNFTPTVFLQSMQQPSTLIYLWRLDIFQLINAQGSHNIRVIHKYHKQFRKRPAEMFKFNTQHFPLPMLSDIKLVGSHFLCNEFVTPNGRRGCAWLNFCSSDVGPKPTNYTFFFIFKCIDDSKAIHIRQQRLANERYFEVKERCFNIHHTMFYPSEWVNAIHLKQSVFSRELKLKGFSYICHR